MEELDLIKQGTVEELEQSLDQHENEGVPENSLLEVKEEPSLLEVKQEQEQEQEQEQVQEQKQEQEQEQGQEDVAATGGGGERWPGWPGESVFRILVPSQKVGGLIGRKGEFIKKMVEESKARIKVLDGPPGTSVRAVMVSAKEEPGASLPPAIDGLLRVHRRVVDGLESDSSHPPPPVAGKVSTNLLVPAAQAGSLIGKQGTTVKSIQEASSCIVRVLGSEDLPVFALQDDRIVEVVGEPAGVHKAVELIASHLRKFLVDRGIIPVFEMQMQMQIHPWNTCHLPSLGVLLPKLSHKALLEVRDMEIVLISCHHPGNMIAITHQLTCHLLWKNNLIKAFLRMEEKLQCQCIHPPTTQQHRLLLLRLYSRCRYHWPSLML
ncbi:hypothetical protein RND71_040951 [Anisodus tanguticus]|uniref:K Homology domain-containing protein n=1 Tax=Anisodus tanguticus TaxID=243964 RepID=A0AAE1UW86_9SOLA|nr:hypothetical protein RND71_040951 [Anisodus tanguticus]